ncbi:Hypothetical protein LBF_1150 [Leptospira biflexa serovar Patoc strain 'Patoc 1 (Ames)']|uniref:Uncharacterized protein n=1 Tax=Leptospira biflexa serovar Patoc (strain Patoc 1 / ATCC 23582 / Paris) TaxID=456481 RepID=B0SNM8_LEPBP|nr:hypothetical protein [Leptospira biflexa]ABZ93674.1 Hypothetical protein LBF_1150 [Leptospira biflexa serovar Patoc strain 'Patoc 1 (Ames)']ABZ97309.1 Hypothetical protein; putative membrane protein [Leptospira biflexa serovar Patoc strain 'Patoc 1 (Paris)']
MISIEIDFIYFFVSLFFLHRCLVSVSSEENKNLLLLYWMGTSFLGFLFLLSLSRWGIIGFGWETKSFFLVLTKFNLILFFTYQTLEERIFSFRRSIGFLLTLLLFVFFSSFFFWIQIFQTEIHAEDQALFLPFTIAVGAFVWSREMFWTNPNPMESKLGEGKNIHLSFLFLPCFLYVLSPFTTNYGFVEMIASVLLVSISSLVGFLLISQILKVSIPEEAEMGVWVGTVSFSSSLGAELLVTIPLAFFVGMFARGMYFYLDGLDWSRSGKRGVVAFLIPSILGIFLPFLVREPKDWVHAPYVLLGVQVLYFLSFYLVSSLVFGVLLLFKPKSE